MLFQCYFTDLSPVPYTGLRSLHGSDPYIFAWLKISSNFVSLVVLHYSSLVQGTIVQSYFFVPAVLCKSKGSYVRLSLDIICNVCVL